MDGNNAYNSPLVAGADLRACEPPHVNVKVIASDAVGFGGPVTPAVRRFDGWLKFFPSEFGFAFTLSFQVIQEFQEHGWAEVIFT
jgi:hypothetical protein